jgi:hypothetical protein
LIWVWGYLQGAIFETNNKGTLDSVIKYELRNNPLGLIYLFEYCTGRNSPQIIAPRGCTTHKWAMKK